MYEYWIRHQINCTLLDWFPHWVESSPFQLCRPIPYTHTSWHWACQKLFPYKILNKKVFPTFNFFFACFLFFVPNTQSRYFTQHEHEHDTVVDENAFEATRKGQKSWWKSVDCKGNIFSRFLYYFSGGTVLWECNSMNTLVYSSSFFLYYFTHSCHMRLSPTFAKQWLSLGFLCPKT